MFAINPEMQEYEIVDSLKKLAALKRSMMKVDAFAFDTETNSLRALGRNDSFKVVGISLSWGSSSNFYIPLGHIREEDAQNQLEVETVAEYLRPVFEREDVTVVAWNLKFDMHVLKRIGIEIKTPFLHDAMIMSWLCNENEPSSLKSQSSKYLKVDQTKFAEVMSTIPKEVKKEFGFKANSKATFDLVLIEDAAPYALSDAFYTWMLYLGFKDFIVQEKMDKIYRRMYMPFIRTLFDMEERGVCVDNERLVQMEQDMKADIDALNYRIIELAGVEFNPSSSQQLGELLFGYVKPKKGQDPDLATSSNPKLQSASFGFPIEFYTDGGSPSTDSNTIWHIAHKEFKNARKREGVELCKTLLDYKRLDKLYSAFVVGLRAQFYDDGKVHPSFNIIGTDSGRLSCSEPNLQQLPKANEEDKYQIRSLFVGSRYLSRSSNGIKVKRKKIVSIDFSNLEMRVLAHFSQDENLLRMFANNEDSHGSTAVNMFELDCDASEVKKLHPHLRQAAKTINFMLMYGGGSYTLYNSLKDDRNSPIDLGDKDYLEKYQVRKGEEVAQIYIDKYFTTYAGVSTFIKNQKRFAKRNGYVFTVLQRKRRLPDINSSDYSKAGYNERLSVNSTIQGSAADITINAQNRIQKDPFFAENGIIMLIQVHDELVFECPASKVNIAIEKLKHYMEHPFGDDVNLNLPLVADAGFGNNYQEAK